MDLKVHYRVYKSSHPRAAYGRGGLQIRRVDANILNSRRQPTRGGTPASELGGGLTIHHR